MDDRKYILETTYKDVDVIYYILKKIEFEIQMGVYALLITILASTTWLLFSFGLYPQALISGSFAVVALIMALLKNNEGKKRLNNQ